ncbi:MAG TPA: hypothetical protein VF807_03525, partial [Ktedonobacterales bacterium]
MERDPTVAKRATSPPRTFLSERLTRPRALTLARGVWVAIAVASLGIFVASIAIQLAHVRQLCPTDACAGASLTPGTLRAIAGLGLSAPLYLSYAIWLSIIFAAVHAVVAALVFWKRSDDPMALLAALAILLFGL